MNCGHCKKPRMTSAGMRKLDPACLSHDFCEKCSAWCYAYNDQDCEHTVIHRQNADLRAELAAVRRDGLLTENLLVLAAELGCMGSTADHVAERAAVEIRRLRQAVAAYAVAAEDD